MACHVPDAAFSHNLEIVKFKRPRNCQKCEYSEFHGWGHDITNTTRMDTLSPQEKNAF